MASRSSLAVSGLGEDDLGDIYEALCPIIKKYKHFGLQIRVKKTEIERIEAQHNDHGDRLLEILTVRVRQTPALTWAVIDKALRSQSVGEQKLADSIREAYSTRSDPVGPSLQGTSDQSFEASDSSPECYRLSESEKLRINIFERFYGRLCCEISNPVETAAQLQAKGVISKVVMKDMMKSPESQQSKTITLIDELDDVIKSQPNCLFVFIKVLLENSTLQRIGKAMLREAGKYLGIYTYNNPFSH